MLNSFFKDSAIYTIPAIVTRCFSFFLVPLYTRVLSTADYGSLDLFISFASIVNLTITLEVSQGLVRYYSSESNFEQKIYYSSSAFWFTIFCYTIFAILATLLTPFLAHLVMGQSGMETAFRLGIVIIWCNGLFYLIQNQLRWEFRSKDYAVVSLLMSFTTAISSIWFAFWLRWGLEGMLLGMVIGSLAGIILGLSRLLNSFRFCFDVGCLRDMLAFSAPLVFSGVAVWISLYIDRIMLNRLLSVEAVGLYGVGYRVASIAGLIMVGFQGAMTPLVYAHHQDPSTPMQLARIFRFFMFFALLVFLTLSLFAQDIVRLLTSEQFFAGAPVVIYLVPAVLLSNMYIFAPGIGIAKKTYVTVWINIGGALLNITLNYMLIPILGIIGAGLATLMSSLSVFVAYMIISQKLYSVPHQWRYFVAVATLAAILGWFGARFDGADFVRWGLNLTLIAFFSFVCMNIGLIRIHELRQGALLMRDILRSIFVLSRF